MHYIIPSVQRGLWISGEREWAPLHKTGLGKTELAPLQQKSLCKAELILAYGKTQLVPMHRSLPVQF